MLGADDVRSAGLRMIVWARPADSEIGERRSDDEKCQKKRADHTALDALERTVGPGEIVAAV